MLSTTRLSRFGDWTELHPSCLSGQADGQRPFFAGPLAEERMNRVRRAINEIRRAWDRYPQFMKELRQFIDDIPSVGVGVGVGDHARWEALLSSSKTWADKPIGDDDYSAIRLYTSETGYRQIFGVINTALRDDDFAQYSHGLRAAAFLVELITIDLFNYWTSHTGVDDFEGTVYRGMCISPDQLDTFRRVAKGPIAERFLSIPLAMASSSTSREFAMRFALEQAARNPGWHLLLWEIDVRSLDPELLGLYHEQFPSGVVTTLCATPIDQLSDYPREQEVLLRGPFFQLLGLTEETPGELARPISRVKAVMLNTNRDHQTTIASNTGADRLARDLFRALIIAYRSTLCADYADTQGLAQDADEYRQRAADSYALIAKYLN